MDTKRFSMKDLFPVKKPEDTFDPSKMDRFTNKMKSDLAKKLHDIDPRATVSHYDERIKQEACRLLYLSPDYDPSATDGRQYRHQLPMKRANEINKDAGEIVYNTGNEALGILFTERFNLTSYDFKPREYIKILKDNEGNGLLEQKDYFDILKKNMKILFPGENNITMKHIEFYNNYCYEHLGGTAHYETYERMKKLKADKEWKI